MKLIAILGPTAVGKTKLAVALADQIGGEVISADSRQVYRGMDIGTGKDLEDFEINNKQIPYHLIDIRDAGEEYDLFQFQQDFYKAYQSIIERGKVPILCGGTGMYIQAALAQEALIEVPTNQELRQKLKDLSDEELRLKLIQLKAEQHNTTDLTDRKRTIRAIEIETFKKSELYKAKKSPVKDYLVFGIQMERKRLRLRIQERLDNRLEGGMIEEVKKLLSQGVSHQKLEYYGLEYKYISQYIEGRMSYDDMYRDLLQAIRRFAKKQMTWYRRMEKMGTQINWLDANMDLEKKIEMIQERFNNN